MSYEEFLEWVDGPRLCEWVNGEIIELPIPSIAHQNLAAFLVAIMRIFVDAIELGCLLCAPCQMKTGPDLPGREPDILFVHRDRLHLLKKNHLDGPADLVVEIVSPDGERRDEIEKFREYDQGGVREYWILNPTVQTASFYVRGQDGRFHECRVDTDGVYHSQVLEGLWLKMAWLWQDPLPSTLDVLSGWGLLQK